MALPAPQLNVQAQYAQDHLSKFADLHVGSNPDLLLHPAPGQHYPAPMLEPRVGHGPRGNQTGQQSGRPMGTTAQVISSQKADPAFFISQAGVSTGSVFSVLSHWAQSIIDRLQFMLPNTDGEGK